MFAVLGVAVAVFISDRISPGGYPTGPDSAQAAVGGDASDVLLPDLTPPASDREAQAAEVRTSLARRLGSVSKARRLGSTGVRDAFKPSDEWVGPRQDKVVVAKAPDVDTAAVKAQEFVRKHRLKGAIVASGRSIAIIDGNCVSVGQKVDGFELKSVTSNTAVLACEGVEVVLNLDAPAPEKVN